MEKKETIQSLLEAVLFAYGEPLSLKQLVAVLGIGQSELMELLDDFRKRLDKDSSRGLCLLIHDEKVQLGTKPEHFQAVDRLMKKDFQQELTPANLEVLTIVLYRGPISRAEIDYIRGVNSSFILRSLLMRGLIERIPDTRGHHLFLYQPSFALLRFLGITSTEELPDYEQLNKKYEEILLSDKSSEEIDQQEKDYE